MRKFIFLSLGVLFAAIILSLPQSGATIGVMRLNGELSSNHWLGMVGGVKPVSMDGGVVKSVGDSHLMLEMGSGGDRYSILAKKGDSPLSVGDNVPAMIAFLSPLSGMGDKNGVVPFQKEMTGFLEKGHGDGSGWVLISAFEKSDGNIEALGKLKGHGDSFEKHVAPYLFMGALLFPLLSAFHWFMETRSKIATGAANPKGERLAFCMAVAGWVCFGGFLGFRPDGLPSNMDVISLFPMMIFGIFSAASNIRGWGVSRVD